MFIENLSNKFALQLEGLLLSEDIKSFSYSKLIELNNNFLLILNGHFAKLVPLENRLSFLLERMSDSQFYSYMQLKYGNHWCKNNILPQEYERIPNLLDSEVQMIDQNELEVELIFKEL